MTQHLCSTTIGDGHDPVDYVHKHLERVMVTLDELRHVLPGVGHATGDPVARGGRS